MRLGSLFTGIGGFDLAAQRAGLKVVFQSEIDRWCNRVLPARFEGVPNLGDITRIDPAVLPAADVLCGGFPCQDLSVAGHRAGLAGERSGLFYQFVRIARGLTPTWIVIENVPGLLSADERRAMGIVLWELGKLGYWWSYRSLDAQYFGLAQSRERVFIVGHLRDRAAAVTVLFESESVRGGAAPRRKEGEEIAGALTAGLASGYGVEGRGNYIAVDPLARTLTAREGLRQNAGEETMIVPASGWQAGGSSPVAIRGREGGSMIESNGGDVSYTVRVEQAGYVGTMSGVRRLTPRECERLQGFPDGWSCLCEARGGAWTCRCPDAPRYRALGNAVAVPVVEWILRRLVAYEWIGHGVTEVSHERVRA